jgi:hypothetical protein
MPVNIIRFERLAYLSLAISMLSVVLDNSMGPGTHQPLWATVIAVVATTLIGGALIWATARLRKNWIRWVYTTLVVLGVAADAWTIPTDFAAHSPLFQALNVGADILDIACVCLLFSAAAGAWFRKAAVACGSPAAA